MHVVLLLINPSLSSSILPPSCNINQPHLKSHSTLAYPISSAVSTTIAGCKDVSTSVLLSILAELVLQGLVDAIRGRDINRVRSLLETVQNLDASAAPLPPMTPPLVEAAASGDLDILSLLLERNPNLDVRDVGLGTNPCVVEGCTSGFFFVVLWGRTSIERAGGWAQGALTSSRNRPCLQECSEKLGLYTVRVLSQKGLQYYVAVLFQSCT
jgi:hypothetical protein